LANTAIEVNTSFQEIITQKYGIGILLGLVVGKPLGIIALTFVAVKLKICKLPSDLNWKMIVGAGCLGGIGFTMSIFITLLAFDEFELQNNSKIVILGASVIAAVIGFVYLLFALKTSRRKLSV
jgi:NhaA family Na+:H+ antiporter